MDISIIVPLFNEDESIGELTEWIERTLQPYDYSYEIIFVDDGSTDRSWDIIQELHQRHPEVEGIRFRRNYGKSAALHTGFQQAKGDVVITMDADLQDSPEEIPELYGMIMKDGYDLVSGWKKERHDPLMKTIPSKFFNFITRKMSGINLHDFNCGLKAYKNEVVKNIEIYGEMHRYIPVIAKSNGYSKIGEKVVKHQARKYGTSKFGLERFINGFLDLLSISFVSRFSKKPMHFFGSIGFTFLIIGTGILLYLSLNKLIYDQYGIAERPAFFFGILLLIVGSQLFLAGFLAELISRNSPNRNSYDIKDIVGPIDASKF